MTSKFFVASLVVWMWVSGADAQTLTSSTDRVAPGETVSVTLTGTAGDNYAIVGSSVGSGLVVAGIPLKVGTDVVLLAIGVLDGNGHATAQVTPPFRGATLDRFYLQAGFSASASFNPFSVSPGLIVRNEDLLGPDPQVRYVTGEMVSGETFARAYCPDGMTVSGGGGSSVSAASLQQNFPIGDESGEPAHDSTAIGWQVSAADGSVVKAFVVCRVP